MRSTVDHRAVRPCRLRARIIDAVGGALLCAALLAVTLPAFGYSPSNAAAARHAASLAAIGAIARAGDVYRIEVSLTGTGTGTVVGPGTPINCPTVCVYDNIPDNEVTLIATASPGSAFDGWTVGPCTGSMATTCIVPVNEGVNLVTARFSLLGACCSPTFNCTNVVQSACPGGSTWTAGGSCAPNSCRPPHDECTGAAVITSADAFATPVTASGSLAGATPELNRFTSPCAGGSGEMNARPGVWYRLMGTGARLHVDTCSGGFDSILMVFCGACDGLTCVASNDDVGALGNDGACAPANPTASSLAFDSETGRTYFIWIGDAAGASVSALTVSVQGTGPNLAAPVACLGCTYPVPVPTVTELEPCTIASNTVASSNAGCDIPAPAFQNLGAINGGTAVTVVGLAQASKRVDAPFTDIDWFAFTSPSGNFLRLEGRTSFPASIQVKDLGPSPGACPIASPDLAVLATTTCGEMFAADLKPVAGRTYAVRITHPSADTQGILCGPSAGYYFALSAGTAGACCDATTGACTEVTFADCMAPSTFLAGTCTPNPCPQPTACCDTTTGACTLAPPGQACAAGSAAASPATSTCTPEPCPQPTACCDTTTGACILAAPGQACGAGTTAAVPATSTCGPNPCPQPIACCNEITGACTAMLGGTCPVGTTVSPAPTCTPNFCPIGACCDLVTGACTQRGPSGCAGPDQFYRGNGSDCSAGPCPAGACCDLANLACTITGVNGCAAAGFTFRGPGTVCNPSPCPSGACCDLVTLSCELRGPLGCNGPNQAFRGVGTVCVPNTCPSGACCNLTTLACTITGPLGCTEVFRGVNSVCMPSPCPSGACCNLVTGNCRITGPLGCDGVDEAFVGTGSVCSPVTCVSGACCDTLGACTVTGVAGCAPPSTFLGASTVCGPNACDPTACCNSTSGACTVAPAGSTCAAGSIPASPAATTCTAGLCPQPTACCDTTTGACTVALPAQACGAGTVAASPTSSTCTAASCPQPTACCNTTTGGCVVALPGQVCPPGTFGGGGGAAATSCAMAFCPQPLACCDTTSGVCTVVPPGVAGAVCGPGTVPGTGNPSACTPGLCPQPTACCNATSGACTIALPSAACPAGTVAGAPLSSTCSAGLCPQPTACCNFITGVCVVALPGAACAAGSAAPGGAAACLPYPCPLIGAVGLACPDCTWVNGAFDGVSGQDSHLGGAIPLGAKAADDFFLCEDFVYDLQVISATLMTTTDPLWVKPIAEIYEDCNGCPGALLYRLDSALVVETGLTHSLAAPDGRPLRIIHASWSIDASQQIVSNRNIVLKGGRYWLSVYGRTDNFSLMTPPMYDVTYWGTTGNGALGVKGLPAKKITGQPTPVYNQFLFGAGCVSRGGAGPGWKSVTDGCCIGCTDLNFSVCTRPCKILIDNGPARNLPGVALGSTSQYAIGTNSPLETRSADDFVIPPCQAYTICYVEACVLTNCPTFEGVFELYTNDCHKPSYTLHGIPFGGNTSVATKVIDLGFVWTVGTAMYRAYKLEFHDLAIVVPGGTQMWISAGVRYTFSLTERAFFCYNEPCAACDIKWNPGRVLTVSSLDLDPPLPGQQPRLGWAALVDDFSFLIAADGNTSPGPINADPPPAPSCAADLNRDGVLNVTDIFDYLTGWFAGCP